VGQGNENGWPLYVQDKDKNRCLLGLAVRLAKIYAIFSPGRAWNPKIYGLVMCAQHVNFRHLEKMARS